MNSKYPDKETIMLQSFGKEEQSNNGLQNLVAYYQSLFDREENYNHYSPDDYQNAKRHFVKYLLNTRAMQ